MELVNYKRSTNTVIISMIGSAVVHFILGIYYCNCIIILRHFMNLMYCTVTCFTSCLQGPVCLSVIQSVSLINTIWLQIHKWQIQYQCAMKSLLCVPEFKVSLHSGLNMYNFIPLPPSQISSV